MVGYTLGLVAVATYQSHDLRALGYSHPGHELVHRNASQTHNPVTDFAPVRLLAPQGLDPTG